VGFWHGGLPPLLGIAPRNQELPRAFEIFPIVPNPFGRSTLIRFAIPGTSSPVGVRIDAFDVTGRLVRVLDRSVRGAGVFEVAWDGSSGSGSRLTGGIYFCRIQAGPFHAIRRVALLR
jgi:hypothetical protein